MSTYFLKICYALLLLLLYVAGSIHGYNKCFQKERQALLKFKQGLLDNYGMLSTWIRNDENNEDCCQWRGIECSNETGHVQILDLHGYKDTEEYLTGRVDITLLFELQNLEYLDLSSNDFRGNQVPEHLLSFRNLRYLNLSYSEFGGRIPYQLGKLSHLQYLDLSRNYYIYGAVPYQLGNLSHLEYLNLEENSLDEAVPYQLRNLSHMVYLNLGGNYLEGTIPFQGGDLPMLHSLRLGGNEDLKIKSENNADAKWLSSLSSLTNLDLTMHNLGSSHHWLQIISKIIPNLQELRLRGCGLSDNDIALLFGFHANISTSLTILDLSYNNILSSSTFQLLSDFSFNIQELYLSNNNFVLSFPPHLNFSSLVILDLSNNDLTSSLFQDGSNFGFKLQELHLKNCSLSDNSFLVPFSAIMNFSSSLLILDLSSNFLTSSAIFHWIFNSTTNLHTLFLHDNLLEGPIPDGFDKVMNSLENIYLFNNKLQGTIPTSFGNICTLRTLVLSNNNFTGEISSFIQNSSWCNRHIFRNLHLSDNRITGNLPKSIGLLSELEDLRLYRNSLVGNITESHLTKLSKLRRFSLSYNSLSLKFGTYWVPPFQLSYLGLASCKLGPSFPRWLHTQSYLRDLDISNTGIVDSVPEWFWHMTEIMSRMNISYNSLRGTVPNFTLKLTASPILVLSSNQFGGSIPSFLLKAIALDLSKNRFWNLEPLLCGESTMGALSFLDVSDNQLKGELPNCWNHLSSLQYLDLSNNNLSGHIPPSIGSLVNLRALILRKNNIIGEIPSTLMSLTSLVLLDIGENKLSGQIPSWIGESLKQLEILSLRVNHLFGRFPSQLCHLTQIKLLDLSKNHLSEQIPKCLWNFTAMANPSINMSESSSHSYQNGITINWYHFNILLMWKGKEDVFSNPELLLKSIDLSNNNLIGEIPIEIGSLLGLVSLNLSRNNLSGEITSRLGNLKFLEFLDLSRNSFSGKIPFSLAQIDRLSALDLSNNHLIGKIPTGTQLQSFDPSSYEGNLDLCGKPLDKICSEDETSVPHVSVVFDHEDEESIVSGGFYMSLGLGFVVGLWGFIGALSLCHSWRYSYIRFLNKLVDNIYVMATLYMARCQRWLRN